MKRLCLFAGFDKDGLIDDYVVYYVKALSEFCDVYYYGDFEAQKGELNKLKGITKAAYAKRHRKYDFGSWQELVKKLGKEKLRSYDEVLLANDSCFGPIFPFKNLFKKMDRENCDFWGLSCSRGYHVHIQSYFIMLRKKVLDGEEFFDFLNAVKPEKSLTEVCTNYEDRFTYLLTKAGYTFRTYVPYGNFEIQPYYNTTNAIKKGKFPLLKVKTFYGEVGFEPIKDWESLVRNNTDYDISLIKNNLYRRGLTDYIIKRKVFYGKRIRKLVKAKNWVKNKIRSLIKPIRKKVHSFIDNKLDYIINDYNHKIYELTNEIDSLKKDTYSLNYIVHNKGLLLKKLFSIKSLDNDESGITFTLKDTFRFRELNNIFLNFDKFGKDVMLIGNFDAINIMKFKANNNRIAIINDFSIDEEDKMLEKDSYEIKNLCNFEIKRNDKDVKVDLLLVQAMNDYVSVKEISRFLYNLRKFMIPDSTLIINVPNKFVQKYMSIFDNLKLINDFDGVRMFKDRITSINNYTTFYLKIK